MFKSMWYKGVIRIADGKGVLQIKEQTEYVAISQPMDVQRMDIQRLPSFEVMIVTATWICAS